MGIYLGAEALSPCQLGYDWGYGWTCLQLGSHTLRAVFCCIVTFITFISLSFFIFIILDTINLTLVTLFSIAFFYFWLLQLLLLSLLCVVTRQSYNFLKDDHWKHESSKVTKLTCLSHDWYERPKFDLNSNYRLFCWRGNWVVQRERIDKDDVSVLLHSA